MPQSVAIALGASKSLTFILDDPIGALTAFIVGGPSAVLSAAVLHESPAPQVPTFTQEIGSRALTVRQPITYRQTVYGAVRVSGPLTFLEESEDRTYIYLVVTLSGHELEEITTVYLDDEAVPLDGSGDATSGRFFKGAETQRLEALVVPWASPATVSVAQAVASVNQVTVQLENGGEEVTLTDVSPRTPENFREYSRSGQAFTFALAPAGTAGWLAGATVTIDYQQALGGSWVRIWKSLGDEGAAQPFPEMAGETDRWTSASQKQIGCGKLALRLEYSPDVFYNGIPNVSADVKGKKVIDYRLSPTERNYSANWALCVADCLTDRLGMSAARLNMGELVAAANVCDEEVELPGSPTEVEARYELHGVLGDDMTHREALTRMMNAARGRLRQVNGQWLIQPAAWRAAAGDTLTEDDLRGALKILPRITKRSLANTVRGLFRGPLTNWQPDDYPQVTNAAYVTEDGTEVVKQLDQPFCKSPYQCQRAGNIELEDNRQQLHVQWTGKLTCYQFQPGSTVRVTLARHGWSAKLFEVLSTTLVREGSAIVGCDLLLKETAAAIYDDVAATAKDPARDTRLPNPFQVDAPTALDFDEGEWQLTGQGTLRWTASAAPQVQAYQVQYKRKGAASWTGVSPVEGDSPQKRFTGLKPGTFRWRVRAVGVLGNRSEWSDVLEETLTPPPVPRITGLALFNNGASHIFSGRDAKFVCRPVATQAVYTLGAEPVGAETSAGSGAAGQGDIDPFFKDYQWEIWDVDATTKAETDDEPVRVAFTRQPEYVYSWERNSEDHAGTPVRIFKVKVYGRDRFGNKSLKAAQMVARNGVPALSDTSPTRTNIDGGFAYAFTTSSDTDFLGFHVHTSLTSGFTPSASTLRDTVRKPPNTAISGRVLGLATGVTNYVRLVPFDVYGDGTATAEFTVVPLLGTSEGGEGDDTHQLGLIAQLRNTSFLTLFGAAVLNTELTKPLYVPSTGKLFFAYKHPSTGNLHFANVDPKEMTLLVSVDSGINLSGSPTPQLSPWAVYVSKTGLVYCACFDGATYRLLGIDPTTLAISWNYTGFATLFHPMAVYPRRGTLLVASDDGSKLILREVNTVAQTVGSPYNLPAGSGFNTYCRAVYGPKEDHWAVPEDRGNLYYVPRGLGSTTNITTAPDPSASIRALSYVSPAGFDDGGAVAFLFEVFVLGQWQAIPQFKNTDGSDAEVDGVSAGIGTSFGTGPWVWCPLNQQLVQIGFDVTERVYNVLSVNPLSYQQLESSDSDGTVALDHLIWVPATKRLLATGTDGVTEFSV